MKNWIIVDLDGTLCDCAHRVHLAQAKQWDEFHAGIPQDKPNKDVCVFVEVMCKSFDCEIVVCTGRDEAHREATLRWLRDNGLDHCITAILMRPNDDRTADHELKPRMVAEFFGSQEAALDSVLMVLDDRDKVVEAWRNAGFRCWQVQAGSY